jgi:hypothetical protein
MICMAIQADPRIPLIQGLITRNSLSYRWLARAMNRDNVSVTNWLELKSRPRNGAVFNQMLDILQTYEQNAKSGSTKINISRLGLRQIPVYPGLSAGTMNSTFSDVATLEIKDWGTDRERWARVVDGYSMLPLLEPGDIVVFENRPWAPGHIVHAYDDGNDTVKVAVKSGSTFKLRPINPEYDDIPGANMNIRGVAVMRIRKEPHDVTDTKEFPHGMRYIFAE